MKTTKQAVLDALTKISAPGEGKNMVESGAVTNVVVFGDEVVVDVVIDNPTLQARKKTEVSVMQVIHAEVDQKLIEDDEINLPIQIKGKLVSTIDTKKGYNEKESVDKISSIQTGLAKEFHRKLKNSGLEHITPFNTKFWEDTGRCITEL
jgi:hypothetical protein